MLGGSFLGVRVVALKCIIIVFGLFFCPFGFFLKLIGIALGVLGYVSGFVVLPLFSSWVLW